MKTIHPQLRLIAERYGVPISERSCHKSYLYDGKTLATTYQLENWNDDFTELLSLSAPIPISDEWMAHEIAHYVVADPVERQFPEYGCTVGVAPFGAAPPFPALSNWLSIEGRMLLDEREGVLTREEQNFREICADFLGTYWCDCIGVLIDEKARPINKITDSIINVNSAYSLEEGWRAVIWLREKGLIP
jgi:hypothetical protein